MTVDVYDDRTGKFYQFRCPADAYAFMNECPEHREIRHHLGGLQAFLDYLGVSY